MVPSTADRGETRPAVKSPEGLKTLPTCCLQGPARRRARRPRGRQRIGGGNRYRGDVEVEVFNSELVQAERARGRNGRPLRSLPPQEFASRPDGAPGRRSLAPRRWM